MKKPGHRNGLALAFGGLLVIALGRGEGAGQMTLAGLVLTVGAALMWALSNLVVRKAAQAVPGYKPLPFIVWSSLVPIVPFVLLAWWSEGWPALTVQWQGMDGKALLAVLYLALLATLLAYSWWTELLQRHAAGRITPFSLLVPVVGLLAAMLLLGERPTPLQWLGALGVLAGMVVNQFGGRWGRWGALKRS